MRIILITILIASFFLISSTANAVTGEQVRFDWTLGQPAITDDVTSACNDTAVARFDWVLGEPAITYDVTANCTLAAADEGGAVTDDFILIISENFEEINFA